MSGVVVGLDLSTTRTGVCVVPVDFGGDLRQVRFASVKRIEDDAFLKADNPIRWGVRMRNSMAQRVIIAADDLRAGRHVVAWAYESIPTRAFSIIQLAMLRAVVLTYLVNERVMECPQSSGRKLFLGSVRSGDAKELVRRVVCEQVERCGNSSIIGSPNHDECDALVVANWAVAELGGTCIASAS